MLDYIRINATYKFTGSPLPVNLLGYSFSRVTERGDRLGGTGHMVLSFRKLSHAQDQRKNHYIITALLNKWVMRIRIRSHKNVVDTLTTSPNYLLRKCIGTNENLNFDIGV